MNQEQAQKNRVLFISLSLTFVIVIGWAFSFDIPKIEEEEEVLILEENKKDYSFFDTVRLGFNEFTALVGIKSK